MPIQIGIEHVLIFCIVQTIMLIAVLLQKRFHQRPNLFLGMIFGLLTSFYILYLFEELGIFDTFPSLKTLKRAVELLPPPLIYNYMWLLINGETNFRQGYKKHFLLAAIITAFLVCLNIIAIIPFSSFEINPQLYYYIIVIGSVIVGIQFIVYGYKLIQLILEKSKSKKSVWNCLFSIRETRYRWVRLMSIIFILHGFIFLIEGVYLSIHPDDPTPLLINVIFYITVGYLFTISLIQNPAIIHFSSKTAGSLALKKYEKSGLTEEEAKSIMQRMNDYMENEKPFIDSNLSIQDLSVKMSLPVHTISEVTNGLMGQNFFDYVNNYRIEEFKRLAELPENSDIKILFLAFDAGFSSKTSFNIAFKKFTGQTPSGYMRKVKT